MTTRPKCARLNAFGLLDMAFVVIFPRALPATLAGEERRVLRLVSLGRLEMALERSGIGERPTSRYPAAVGLGSVALRLMLPRTMCKRHSQRGRENQKGGRGVFMGFLTRGRRIGGLARGGI